MISAKFTQTFTVKRTEWTTITVGSKEVEQTVEVDGESFNGYLQQATPEYAQYNNLTMTKAYSLWCPLSAKIAEGDTVFNNGTAYMVRARQDYRDGDNPHAQVALELVGVEYGS